MANGSLLAGISFSNSMVGVVHGLAHACGGVSRVPHGVANAILLPWGMEYNLGKSHNIIAELAPYLGATLYRGPMEAAKNAVQAVRDFGKRLEELCGLPTRLRDAGVTEDKLDAIAKTTVNDGTMTYNPEEVTYQDALDILKKAF
jgi:alcohol dehydrogenase